MPLVARVYSYWLIDHIPDSGLLEMIRKLEEIRDYHLELAVVGLGTQEPKKTILRAKPGKRYDRPIVSLPSREE